MVLVASGGVKLDRFLAFVATAFFSIIFSAFPLATYAEGWSFSHCYGDVVDFVFPASQTGGTAVHMSVPSKNLAVIELIDGRSLYGDSPCNSEPLEIARVLGSLSKTPLGNEIADTLMAKGVYPRFFRLSPAFPDAVHPTEASRRATLEADGVEQPDGLRFVFRKDNPQEMGVVGLPPDYSNPQGAPLIMSCGPGAVSCDLTYTMRPAFHLSYEILNVGNHRFTAQWGEIDRGVRSTLLSWIKEE